jgi:hypothetical protein
MIVLASLLGALHAKPDREAPEKKWNYYPLEVGNTWHFKATVNGAESKIVSTIAKQEKINDKVLARLDVTKGATTEHLIQNDKGVFRHRYNGGEVNPPFQVLPYPPKVGTKWKGEHEIQNQKISFDAEIQAEENVEVAAGKYKALKVHITLVVMNQTLTSTFWYANDVGFVKQTVTDGANIDVTLELEKFERNK